MNEIEESYVRMFGYIKKDLDNYYIFKEKKKFADYMLRIIYKIWGKYIITNKCNYNHIALSFNKVYFWKNLLKNLIFFDMYFDLIGDSILDVGCGAAPVSIAIAYLAKTKKKEGISFFLIDKSENQLNIARDLTRLMSIQIESYIEEFFNIKCERYSKLVIFSYFFCEQKKDFMEKLFNNRGKFTNGFVVIDHKDNIIKLKKYFKIYGDDNIEIVNFNYSVPSILTEFIHDKEVNVHGCFYRP